MRSFSGSFVSAMNSRRHEFFLTLVIHARLGAGDIYLCDTNRPSLAGHFPLIRANGWGELSTLAPSDEQNLSIGAITIDFVNQVIPNYGRLSDYLRLDPEAILCEVFYNFKVGASIFQELAFPGVIQGQPISFDEVSGKLSIQSLHQLYLDRPMLQTIDPLKYPDADSSALNKVIPICLGNVDRVPGSMIKRQAFNIINSHDPNAGRSSVVFAEAPRFFGAPSMGDIYWGDVPIQSGDAGLPLSQNLNGYIGMLLSQLQDSNEFILTTRAEGGFASKVITLGNGGDYRQVAIPFTVPSDIINPVLQNISSPIFRLPDTNPGPIAIRVTKLLGAYGAPFNDFYGDNFDQSLGYYGWPSGDVARRNLNYLDVNTDNGGQRDDNAPLHSFDAPLEAGRRYLLKIDASNVNQDIDSSISGVYKLPLHDLSKGPLPFDGAYRFSEQAYGSPDGLNWEPLKGVPYIPMSIRGGGGASLYTKDTSPLDNQSGTFVGLFSIGPKGIIAREMSAALSAPDSNGDTASLEVISLNRGPTLGQTILTLTFTADDFTEGLNVVAGRQVSHFSVSVDRNFYLVRKSCALTLIPPGEYAVRFSGSSNPPPPVNNDIPPPISPPAGQPSRFEIGTGGMMLLGGVGGPTQAVQASAGMYREQIGASGVFLTPPAFPPPNTAPSPLPRLVTPTGVPIHGMFEIHGAKFTKHVGFDGYSLVPVDNVSGDPRIVNNQRSTAWVEFDVVLPTGTTIKADLRMNPDYAANNILAALKEAGVPDSFINSVSFSNVITGSVLGTAHSTVIKFNGLFDTAMSFKQAILKMGFEGHLIFDWDDKARVSDPASYWPTAGIPSASLTIGANDISATRKIKNMSLSRSDITKCANCILLKYERDWSGSGPNAAAVAKGFSGDVPILVQSIAPYQSVIELLDLYSIMLYGRLERADLFKLDFIADELSATELGEWFILNYGRPKDIVEITLHTSALAAEAGDVAAFNSI